MRNREQGWKFREGCIGEGGEDGAQKIGLQRLKHILTFTHQEVHHRRLLKEGQREDFSAGVGHVEEKQHCLGQHLVRLATALRGP